MKPRNFCLFTFSFLLVFQRLLPGFGHVSGVPHCTVFAEDQDALFAVGAKNKGKNLRDRVVEFLAGIGCFEGTVGARAEFLIDVACADVAPMISLNLFATGAFAVEVFPAGAAIQSAVGNQLWVVFDFGVHFTSI